MINAPTASHSLTIRLTIQNKPGMLGKVTSAIGKGGGDIGAIDLVVVNLYPFEATVAKGAGRDEIIENIDIGGPSMVRSAAKKSQLTGEEA